MSTVITPRGELVDNETLFAFDVADGSWGNEPVASFVNSTLVQSVTEQGHPSLDRVAQLIAVSGELWFDRADLAIVKRSDGKMFGVSFFEFETV